MSQASLTPLEAAASAFPDASGASAAPPAHPLPSYLQADNLGPWGNYLQQVDRVIHTWAA